MKYIIHWIKVRYLIWRTLYRNRRDRNRTRREPPFPTGFKNRLTNHHVWFAPIWKWGPSTPPVLWAPYFFIMRQVYRPYSRACRLLGVLHAGRRPNDDNSWHRGTCDSCGPFGYETGLRRLIPYWAYQRWITAAGPLDFCKQCSDEHNSYDWQDPNY